MKDISTQQAQITQLLEMANQRLDNLHQPIAVVGMACRFPRASGPNAYWELLNGQNDASMEVPANRWNNGAYYDEDMDEAGKTYVKRGSFLERIDEFDAAFFGIAPREAEAMDPQQRLFLEVAWEAIESAGMTRDQLRGTHCGIYLGITTNDYGHWLLQQGGLEKINPWYSVGNAHNSGPGRLAYFLGVHGPAMAIDSACSSSMVGLEVACTALRQGRIETALVGGVNLMLIPETNIILSKARMLAPDGRCKTFDAAANGYGRGEGCGVVMLKGESAARRDGDRILALIHGVSTNHDGASAGFTVPSGSSQQAVINQTLKEVGCSGEKIGYLEAHGTGTPLGDPIELRAVGATLSRQRSVDHPLWVGSAKTHIGHLESAAGMAGLIKVILGLKAQKIPPHLNFETGNPDVDWDTLGISIPRKAEDWPKDRPLAGISSFGASGTNAFAVLGPGEAEKPGNHPPGDWPLLLSAPDEAGLRRLAVSMATALTHLNPGHLGNFCYTAAMGRTRFEYRLALVADHPLAFAEGIKGFLSQQSVDFSKPGEVAGTYYGAVDTAESTGGDAANTSKDAKSYASRFVRGEHTGSFFVGKGCNKIDLAHYPFQRDIHWPDLKGAYSPELRGLMDLIQTCDQQGFIKRMESDPLLSEATKNQLGSFYEALTRLGGQKEVDPVADCLYQVAWEKRPMAALIGDRPFMATPLELCEHLRGQLQEINTREEVVDYLAPRDVLEALSVGWIQRCFRDMAAENDDNVVVPQHRQLLKRLNQIIDEANHWRDAGERRFQVDVAMAHKEALERYPQAAIELDLLGRCGEALPEILKGRDPLPLLFPGDEQVGAADLYTHSTGAKAVNELIAKTIEKALEQLPEGRPLRILEIGAGTGGTTAAILPVLPADRTQYVYTDISPALLAGARVRFADYDFLTYQVLNVEKEPVDLEAFDLIIAANVLHATENLETSLGHVRALMRPGGMLLLLEGTEPLYFIDLIFGLTPGWWCFEGDPSRKDHPLISATQWCGLLEKLGLSAASLGDDGLLATQSVLLAQAPEAEVDGSDYWLIFGDEGGVGEALAEALASKDRKAVVVSRGDEMARLDSDGYSLNPSNRQDFEQLLQELGSGCNGMVYLWGFDIDEASDLEMGCGGLLNVVGALANHEGHGFKPPRLWVLTADAVGVNEDDQVDGLYQAPLHGMVRTLNLEHSDFLTTVVDVDDRDAQSLVDRILPFLDSSTEETSLALRKDQAFTARLQRYVPQSEGVVAFSEEAAYLITGGLGGLGLLVADWMIARGARHITLLSRGEANGEAKARIAAMEEAGAEITLARADVANRDELLAALVKASERYPLRGVIHGAGLLADGLLKGQTWSHFSKPFAAKIDGSALLHELTDDLDFFILFASGAALLGSPGQANHSAANAFEDALAHHRRSRGQTALSIDWGAWAEVGAAARHKTDERVALKGLGAISPTLGLAVLERIFKERHPQIGAMPIIWPRLLKHFGGSPYLERFWLQAEWEKPEDMMLATLKEQPEHRRLPALKDHVQTRLAQVLGLKGEGIEAKRGFFDLGMDSLSSVELRNLLSKDLGVELPTTLTLEYPSIEVLSQFLVDLVFPPLQIEEATHTDEDNLDLAALLDAELDALEGEV